MSLWWESVLQESQTDSQAFKILIESITAIAFEMGLLTFLIVMITSSYFMRKWQTRKFKLYYQPSQQMYRDLLKQTNLATMKYRPHLMALNNHLQGVIYTIFEIIV